MNLSDSRTAGQPAPLARLSAAEAVFAAIRGDIESGVVPVGGKLSSEATLAQQYGVSRSVIREALRSCTALGLTVTKTGKGTFVIAAKVANDLTLGQYSARDLTEARPHIEIPAAGLAAQRRTAEELETLRHLMDAMSTETDPESWVALDSSFHAAIARASGNKVFASVVADIRDALARTPRTSNTSRSSPPSKPAPRTRRVRPWPTTCTPWAWPSTPSSTTSHSQLPPRNPCSPLRFPLPTPLIRPFHSTFRW